jgi:hypothetical protein
MLGVDEIAIGEVQAYWHLVSALDGQEGSELLYYW